MELTTRHLVALAVACGLIAAGLLLANTVGPVPATLVALVGGVFGVLYGSPGVEAGPSSEAMIEGIRRAARGESVSAPAGITGGTIRVYEELSQLSRTIA